ncbi:MAG: peptidase M50 [Clostridiales bacterium]|nr:peptidase M50 [Clostridiales bacterium]
MSVRFDRRGLTAGRVTLTADFLFLLALLLYTGVGPVLGCCGLAAALHETGHVLCCRALGVPVRRLRLSLVGVELDLGGRCRSGAEECLVALAGPLVNLLTAALALASPLPNQLRYLFAGASLMLALFNLLPVLPLDGSRVLHGALSALYPLDRADRVTVGLSRLLKLALLPPGTWCAALGNPSLLVVAVWLILSEQRANC